MQRLGSLGKRATLELIEEAQSHMYESAMGELKSGQKFGHWIWYIFPQVSGLGFSVNATRYSIKSIDEARGFVGHPLLGPRYLQSLQVVREQVCDKQTTLDDLFNSRLDAMKFVSSATLFSDVTVEMPIPVAQEIHTLCDSLLGEAALQGFRRCEFTEAWLAKQKLATTLKDPKT